MQQHRRSRAKAASSLRSGEFRQTAEAPDERNQTNKTEKVDGQSEYGVRECGDDGAGAARDAARGERRRREAVHRGARAGCGVGCRHDLAGAG
ncbi:hypothetical protein BN2476_350188 [Paraburkholderia piptadeniae]|uniref:Uncharacterized protein n=1 Tax=Paraburkholderia piptadeniae TaxID=1701573 RepID=A0A1N7S895_9BURK|nr:hypothetical protein BN2476_350188 [Paraburkholderia piptadeniae]